MRRIGFTLVSVLLVHAGHFGLFSQNTFSINFGRTDEIPAQNGTALHHFKDKKEIGFQSSDLPNFVVYNNSNFAFGIGGYVNLRVGYDVKGIADDVDFYTYDIPVESSISRQRFFMDGTTSRLFFKTVADTKPLGMVTTYIETDFRGSGNNLRLRKAYISFKGLLFGKNFTNFNDTGAPPVTVDFEDPNSYVHKYSYMIRYEYDAWKRLKLGIAIENPDLGADYNEYYGETAQKVPDIPVYINYLWGNGAGHFRIVAIFRNLYYRDLINNQSRSEFGWGVNFGISSPLIKKIKMYRQLVYGEGIAQYIQDLNGNGYDLVADDRVPGKMQTLKTFGWFGALQYNFTSKWFCSGTYGYVRVYGKEGFETPDAYRLTDYVAVNTFYNIIPSCQLGIEYLYGRRKNFNGESGRANCIYAMIQYNF